MIESVSIKNLGVIEEAEVNFAGGLTAITGETGAGKTMAVTSLLLLLGAKADPSRVRMGSQVAEIEGNFLIPDNAPILERIREAGGHYDIENGYANVIIARTVPVQGRSRAYVGGRSVPTAVLKDIAQSFVTVHGQSDQIRLTGSAQQRSALDAFGGKPITDAKKLWTKTWKTYTQAVEKLEDYRRTLKDSAQRRLAYEALLAKVDEVAPYAGEEEELKNRAMEIENSTELFESFSRAVGLLAGNDMVDSPSTMTLAQATDCLRDVEKILEGTNAGHDATTLVSRLDTCIAEIDDIVSDISQRAGLIEADPEELSRIYERRQELAGLRKELGMGIPEILEAADVARAGLDELGDPESHLREYEKAVEEAQTQMNNAGKALCEARLLAGRDLSHAVNAELPSLSLPHARFIVEVKKSEPSANGMDSVDFLLATHAGAPIKPLGESASGGELSRVMLAIEVSLATRLSEDGHTFLFDEIDAGVGGSAATAIGQRLAQLAQRTQVIVVTHLAQVAVFARKQDIVEKETVNNIACTQLRTVEGDQRLEELARMLSGSVTDAAITHAAELLSQADMAIYKV
ncbi:DNA repair protein RecN [Actinotignum urinale]|uniref:DNA repair protein RecN n=1 Tax=Actinotignum urinale TaxID=190146 RepID=UPI0003B58942|nr:DNA repair protein RecN [Actinotignum urinale]MDY5160349.1 DNA repair protein RecN [Actinotignum urinale]